MNLFWVARIGGPESTEAPSLVGNRFECYLCPESGHFWVDMWVGWRRGYVTLKIKFISLLDSSKKDEETTSEKGLS